jgi:rhamnogalacturonan endolyase
MTNYKLLLTAISLFLALATNAQDSRERTYQYEILEPQHEKKPKVQGFSEKRVVENLSRGLTAVLSTDGKAVYLSWRLLNSDEKDISFNIYRSVNGKLKKLNSKPVILTTDFSDLNPLNKMVEYSICPVIKKKERKTDDKINVDFSKLSNFTSIKLQGNDRIGKIAVADLNGDGEYDYIVRTPDSNVDPGMPGDTTGITFKISAYLHDGTYLWSYDMGLGIEPGIWYSPYVAYDFNGDGKAEIAIKGAGSDYLRNKKGRVYGGSEYLVVLDGMTGKVIDRVDWPERNFRLGDLNRQNRNQIGMAYLDGKTPCILAARGTYRLMMTDAWQLKGNKLEKLWHFDGDEENPIMRSQGSHNMVCGDVDDDGRDEILLGSCMLDDNGTLLWSTGLGHSDKAYLTQIDPKRSGMQVFLVSEPWQTDGRGVMLVDAKTGKQIWKIGQPTLHVGDGMVTDFDPSQPGLECFASEDKKGGSDARYLLTSNGKKLNSNNEEVPECRNWVWWDADLLREIIGGSEHRPTRDVDKVGKMANEVPRLTLRPEDHGVKIMKWKGNVLTSNIKGNIIMIADITGDWREEIITSLPGEIRIYQTNIPAKDRRITLMQDPVYRSYVLERSQGYPQSPVPGYYLGE